jgi:hypothetical protein
MSAMKSCNNRGNVGSDILCWVPAGAISGDEKCNSFQPQASKDVNTEAEQANSLEAVTRKPMNTQQTQLIWCIL